MKYDSVHHKTLWMEWIAQIQEKVHLPNLNSLVSMGAAARWQLDRKFKKNIKDQSKTLKSSTFKTVWRFCQSNPANENIKNAYYSG